MQIVQNLCFTQTHKFQTFTECYANLNGSTTNSSTLVHQRVFIFNFEFYIFLVKFSIIYVISNEIQAIKNHTKHCTTSFERPSSVSSTIFYFFIESILIPMQSRLFMVILELVLEFHEKFLHTSPWKDSRKSRESEHAFPRTHVS